MCLGIPGKIVQVTDTHTKMGLALISGLERIAEK